MYLDRAIALAQLMDVPLESLTREPTAEEKLALFQDGERRRAQLATGVSGEFADAFAQLDDHDGGDDGLPRYRSARSENGTVITSPARCICTHSL